MLPAPPNENPVVLDVDAVVPESLLELFVTPNVKPACVHVGVLNVGKLVPVVGLNSS